MKITAENKHLDFALEMDTNDTFIINGDAGKLKQVLLNLVDNSIKYTPTGFVHLSLTRDKSKNTITFAVKDSGVGISPETKDKLFGKQEPVPAGSPSRVTQTSKQKKYETHEALSGQSDKGFAFFCRSLRDAVGKFLRGQALSRGEGGKLNTGGSGLGLYLAQEITKAHKGKVIIESEGLGKWATFKVVLGA